MKDLAALLGNLLALAVIVIVSLSVTLFKTKKAMRKYKKNEEYTNKLAKECTIFLEKCKSNLTVIPYMAGVVAEIETIGYSKMASWLNWGEDKRRLKKVSSILEIKRDAKQKIMQAKQAEYQLKYLLSMFPSLEDLLDVDYSNLPHINSDDLSDRDLSREFLSKEEWQTLSSSERNQLALDRYVSSNNKTKWQVGRDYEEYVAYLYRKNGFSVDNCGEYMGLEDMGRDIIAEKDGEVHIVQCKYWSAKKEIHEKHINQLFGTMTSYAIEHEREEITVKGVFITNICLSSTAYKFAGILNIDVVENLNIGEFPRIKCNIGRDGSKIYHLPFDQQYDSTKVDKEGEFFAFTVEEAEAAGFRRAFKWHGNHNS